MTSAPPSVIQAQPFTADAYKPYGDAVSAGGVPFSPANFGNAQRYNFLSDVRNLRATARLNLCIFRCKPFIGEQMHIRMMEKHPFSTQVFLPTHDGRYITIVALGADAPELSTLKAFVVQSPQGITYHPGVWHYPMTALSAQLDLACLVHEDGSEGDCQVVDIAEIVVRIS